MKSSTTEAKHPQLKAGYMPIVSFVSHMECEKCVVEMTRIDEIIAGLNGRPYKILKA